MMLRTEHYIIAGLTVVLTGGFMYHQWKTGRLERSVREAGLATDAAEARADSSRDVSNQLRRIIGDTVSAVERRALQAEIRADALDRALGRSTQAIVTLTATVQQLAARGTAPVTVTGDDVRRALFQVDTVPYHATADVALPKPPGEGTIDLKVRIDPASITPRVQCGEKSPAGIRPATVLVTSPDWLTLNIGQVQADDEVCNPLSPGSRWKIRHGFFAGLGYGVHADSTGNMKLGPQLTVGYGFTWSPFSKP